MVGGSFHNSNIMNKVMKKENLYESQGLKATGLRHML